MLKAETPGPGFCRRPTSDGGTMTNLPALTGKKVVKALKNAGFVVIRIRSSHHFMRHPDGRTTIVPVHAGETIGSGLTHKNLARLSNNSWGVCPSALAFGESSRWGG